MRALPSFLSLSLLGLFVALLASAIVPAGATVYVVNPDGTGDYPTIQAAIDACVDGDIVELTDGTFVGQGNRNIDCLGKAITVRSQNDDPQTCIIDCSGAGGDRELCRGFYFHMAETSATILRGVTVTGGRATDACPGCRGGAIYCRTSSPWIENCIFTDNQAENGGALAFRYAAAPTLVNCVLQHNRAHIGGAAEGPGSPIFIGCTFADNEATAWGGGLGFWGSGNPIFTGCIFDGNWALAEGGGLWCIDSTPVVTACTFTGNLCDHNGGAIWTTDAMTLERCTFWGNATGTSGAGVYTTGFLTLESCIVAFSTQGEAVACRYEGDAVAACCDVFGNAGGDWIGCLFDDFGINGNICADPLLCDPENGNFRLREDSPCAPFTPPNPECDLIGAWGVGCASTVADGISARPVELLLWSTPNPFCARTTLAYRASVANPAGAAEDLGGPIRVEIRDVTGRLLRTFADLLPGARDGAIPWDGTDHEGRRLSSGVYWCCLRAGPHTAGTRVVLLR